MADIKYFLIVNDGKRVEVPLVLARIIESSIQTGKKSKSISAEYKIIPGNKLEKVRDIDEPGKTSGLPVNFGIILEPYYKMIPVVWKLLNKPNAFLAVAVDMKEEQFISSIQGVIDKENKDLMIEREQLGSYPNWNDTEFNKFIEYQLSLIW